MVIGTLPLPGLNHHEQIISEDFALIFVLQEVMISPFDCELLAILRYKSFIVLVLEFLTLEYLFTLQNLIFRLILQMVGFKFEFLRLECI